MEILYLKEHTSCGNYRAGKTTIFSYHELAGDREFTINHIDEYLFLFLLSGEISISLLNRETIKLEGGNMISLCRCPLSSIVSIRESKLLILSFETPIIQCDKFFMEQFRLSDEPSTTSERYVILSMCEPVIQFVKTMALYLDSKMFCAHVEDLKLSEWFFLMKAFYTKSDNAKFFMTLHEGKNRFVMMINEKKRGLSSVKALAKACNMTEKTLTRNFRRYYNTTPKRWLMESKRDDLLLAIMNTDEKMSAIGDRFGFSSDTHLSNYCKRYFKFTPTEIRGGKMTKL